MLDAISSDSTSLASLREATIAERNVQRLLSGGSAWQNVIPSYIYNAIANDTPRDDPVWKLNREPEETISELTPIIRSLTKRSQQYKQRLSDIGKKQHPWQMTKEEIEEPISYGDMKSVYGDHEDTERVYFRKGAPPASGRSFNTMENKHEAGVSAYVTPEVGSFAGFVDRPWYYGYGTVVGTGGDDEPLLKTNPKTWKKWPGHRKIVQEALNAGEDVPADVLKDYPRIKKNPLPEPRHEQATDLNAAITKAAGETDTSPTESQLASGNYRKGKVRVQGLELAIENPRGSIRRGPGWQVKLKDHYGYIKRVDKSEADGDHIDCFIGPTPESELVFIVDQNKPDGSFDEHKTMIGWTSAAEAKQAYLDNYSAGWKGFAAITPMTMEQFKAWLDSGDTSRAVAIRMEQAAFTESDHPRDDSGEFAKASSAAHKASDKANKSDKPEHHTAAAEAHSEAYQLAEPDSPEEKHHLDQQDYHEHRAVYLPEKRDAEAASRKAERTNTAEDHWDAHYAHGSAMNNGYGNTDEEYAEHERLMNHHEEAAGKSETAKERLQRRLEEHRQKNRAEQQRYEAKDAQGHEHAESGPKGGQFVSTGSGGGGKPDKPKGKDKPAKEKSQAIEPIDNDESDDDEPVKRPAIAKGKSVSAQREGKGKDARIVMSDGSTAPPHITPAMIPPAWENVQVYPDPDSEVWVKATMTGKNGKTSGKAVYKPSYEAEMQAAKFTRVNMMQGEIGDIDAKIQSDRNDPKWKDAADAAFLMREQATRPGSESDTKGLAKHYGREMTADNVVITPAKGKGAAKVALKFGDDVIPVKDAGTAAEIQRRLDAGESLEDSTYWLKSHGATTLEGRNVVEAPDGVRLQFVGKEGVWHDHLVENPELAKMLVERKATAKERGGKLFGANDSKVSDYVKTLDHGRISPKDLRTNRANEIAAAEVKKLGDTPPKDAAEAKARKMAVATTVSRKLGNRPQQCIESYIDPSVWSHPAFTGAA